MPGIYDGLKIVDFTTTIAGPHCTRLLADLGANVIKIETPDGDMMRSRPPVSRWRQRDVRSAQCRQKERVARPEVRRGAARTLPLIVTADVIVENYRPGVTKRLGIDYRTLSRDPTSWSTARSPATDRPVRARVLRPMHPSFMPLRDTTSRI